MIAGLTINRKLQFFTTCAHWGRRLGCFLTACGLLSLASVACASISLPPPTPEKTKAEKKQELPHPPQAVPVIVQVLNGGTVQVALRVYGRQEQTTGYLIRKEPKLGKIIDLQPTEKEVWVLTYQHTAGMRGQAVLQDQILFAAQNKNGTSSAAEITINIVDYPPELEVTSSVEFGEIAAGFASTRSVTLANKGGGTLEGNITADAPWSVEPASYKLDRGQKTALRVSLTPDADREYQGHLHFSSDFKTEPILHANAFAPFTAEPVALELSSAPGKPERTASFTLTNRTADTLTLQVEANERLHLPAQIALPPKAVRTLQPTLAAKDADGMEATIRVFSGGISRNIKVHAASIPTQAEPPRAPDLITPPSPPGVTSTPTPAPTPPRLLKTEISPDVDPAALNAVLAKTLGKPSELPTITGAVLAHATDHGTAECTWDTPLLKATTAALTYRVEIRRISFDANKNLIQKWIAIPNVQCTQTVNRVTGFITGIPPGVRETARIVAVNAKGELCAISLPFPFHIPAPARFFTSRKVLLAGFTLLGLFGLVLHLKQKRRQ